MQAAVIAVLLVSGLFLALVTQNFFKMLLGYLCLQVAVLFLWLWIGIVTAGNECRIAPTAVGIFWVLLLLLGAVQLILLHAIVNFPKHDGFPNNEKARGH